MKSGNQDNTKGPKPTPRQRSLETEQQNVEEVGGSIQITPENQRPTPTPRRRNTTSSAGSLTKNETTITEEEGTTPITTQPKYNTVGRATGIAKHATRPPPVARKPTSILFPNVESETSEHPQNKRTNNNNNNLTTQDILDRQVSHLKQEKMDLQDEIKNTKNRLNNEVVYYTEEVQKLRAELKLERDYITKKNIELAKR